MIDKYLDGLDMNCKRLVLDVIYNTVDPISILCIHRNPNQGHWTRITFNLFQETRSARNE